ncbi:hypothetical protein ACIBCT_35160 [Streptosporangium sp. NPDC050855]|uniref:hypothetical protein n=1 Tax=Streptosporangium sp. NPDC050855 TaxID=3366194 RepID=UPI003788BB33
MDETLFREFSEICDGIAENPGRNAWPTHDLQRLLMYHGDMKTFNTVVAGLVTMAHQRKPDAPAELLASIYAKLSEAAELPFPQLALDRAHALITYFQTGVEEIPGEGQEMEMVDALSALALMYVMCFFST